MDCRKCGAHLTSDEKAIYMKLVSRTASSFLCMDCLAEALHCERKRLKNVSDIIGNPATAYCFDKQNPSLPGKYNSGEEGFL